MPMPSVTNAGGAALTAQSVTAGQLADAARFPGWLPTSAIASTFAVGEGQGNLGLVSGSLQMSARVVLPAGRQITTISVLSGGQALAVGTHQWFALFDLFTRAKLAVTADDTSAAWAASTIKTLTLSAPYTPAVDTAAYIGVLVTASTMPFLNRNALGTALFDVAPKQGGISSTGLTDPASCPNTAGAIATGNFPFYAYVS